MIPIASRVAALRPTAVNSILADVRAQVARATPGPLVSLMRGEPDLPTPALIARKRANWSVRQSAVP